MEEKFILLPFDTKYAISNKGNLMNVKNGKKLKTVINNNGYLEVQLSTKGVRKNYRIHRLVAMMFLENSEDKPYVNHIDGDKLNNKTSNLEWCTAQENDIHARKTKLKIQNKPIKAIEIDTNCCIYFESLSECARYFNTNKGTIHRVLNKKRNKYKNFKFIYV
jgi:hypothetical protein